MPAGTLLIAMYGATVGRLGISQIEAATNQAVCSIYPSSQLHRDFLFYYLLKIRESLISTSFGGAQPNISQTVIRDLVIPLPPLPEQQRIAAILDEQMAAVDKARAAAEERLAAVNALPAAYLRQVFPQPGAPLPNGWRWMRLGEAGVVISGQHILEADYNYDRTGIGYLTGPADFQHTKARITKWTEKPKVLCEPMDVLVTVKGAGVGKVNLAPDETAAIGRQLMAVRANTGVADTGFLFWFAVTRFEHLQEKAMGATVPGLSRDDLESLDFPLPPLPEQQRIAALLDDQMAAVDKARAAAEAELETINALPAALLRRAFNGEL